MACRTPDVWLTAHVAEGTAEVVRLALGGAGGVALAELHADAWRPAGWALEGRDVTCLALRDGELVAGTAAGALRLRPTPGAGAGDAGLGRRQLRALAAYRQLLLAGTP